MQVCKKLMEDISYHELLLLQTLGFEVAVEHPHKHVVLGTQLVGGMCSLQNCLVYWDLSLVHDRVLEFT